MADSSEDILQGTYEKAHKGAHSVVYKVVEKIPFDLLRQKVMDEILDNHIANYCHNADAAEKICGKLLSRNAFMEPIAASIH